MGVLNLRPLQVSIVAKVATIKHNNDELSAQQFERHSKFPLNDETSFYTTWF